MQHMKREGRDGTWNGIDVDLSFDPTIRSVARIMHSAQEGMVRGVNHAGTTIVFDAWKATHSQVRAALGYPQSHLDEEGCDFWVVLVGEEPFSPDWGTSDENPVRDGLGLIAGRGVEMMEGTLIDWFADAVLGLRQ